MELDNVYVVMFLFWPAVVLVSAGINMLISWTFSWSELVFDYFIGVIAGYVLFQATRPDPDEAVSFFFVFSHGLPALLWTVSESFRSGFDDIEIFFWTMAGIRAGATLWSAALDHGSVKIGSDLSAGGFLFSLLLLAPVKIPFALFTGGVGFLIWLAGLFWAIGTNTDARKKAGKTMGKASFAGGVFVTEFSPSTAGHHATTLGFTVHTWFGKTPFKHELYHSRQYIYMSDWLIPFWLVGCVWGLISAAISSDKNHKVGTELMFGADGKSLHVGNPIEVAAYHL